MRRRNALALGLAAYASGSFRGAQADDPPQDSDPRSGVLKGAKIFDVPVKTISLGENLALLSGPGGNMLLLTGRDGPLLIDCGISAKAEEVRAAAEKFAGGPIAFVINTHWHPDHSGGNATFLKRGAKILSTAATKRRLGAEQVNEVFKITFPAQPPEALPSLTLAAAELLHDGETVQLESVPPAHTDGDLFVHLREADLIHCGDLVNNGFYPAIDSSSRGWIGGMIAGAGRILEVAGPRTRIIPGHGPLAAVDDLRAYRAMLVAVYDRVAPMVDAGKTVDEVLAARPTGEFDAKWGGGFFNGAMFTRLAYVSIAKKRAEPGGKE
ncbi:MBL fold metallo-hydrolase [Paludisphaera mucosa]|uniref:MBL fold metallo-hydrolase n=1 Tax=Paludisphaera mucosa TaxID=3030827 RepID=A0ABT6F802_9BACT|nr:MBL fold metallo-hydrolase [Paludisphaera mucosa]MDG3003574.1 MBL fold metallo-hydrolase [Paludisphaera mucosa]